MFTIEIFLMKFKEFLIQLLHYHSIPIKIEALNLLDDKDALFLNENRILIVLKDEFITQSQLNELENYCTSHQIRFIQVDKNEFLHKRILIENRILSLFKIRNRIHGRACKVDHINKTEAEEFLKIHHSLGATGAPNRYGLFYKNTLIAVASFSKARVMTYEDVPYYSYVWERYASLSDSTVIGGMGKLLKAFITESGAKHIMTYADLNWGTGESFKKLGFKEIKSKEFQIGSNHDSSVSKTTSSLKYILDLR